MGALRTLNWMSYVDLNLRLPELLLMRVDKMSMGVGLEGRVPFLDHEFVGLALSIPQQAKTNGGTLKHILKKAVRGVIPDELIDRPKQGFGVPVYEWLFDRLGDARAAGARRVLRRRRISSTAARCCGSSTRSRGAEVVVPAQPRALVEGVRGVKQVLIRGGGVAVEDVPAPVASPRGILVRVEWSCVSVGTESASVAMSGLPLYRRALKQPEHAKRALEIARNEGFVRTFKRIRGQLAAGLPTGYSAAGVVVEVGDEVDGFATGDRVACAGAGHRQPRRADRRAGQPRGRACPTASTLDAASTVTLGAIALQGVRRAAPALGEAVGVIGLGILGQLTVQLLRAAGCRVLATDLDPGRVALAVAHGAEDASGDFAERVRAR